MQIDYGAIFPEIKVSAAACLLVVLDLGFRGRWRVTAAYLSLAALVGALLDVVGLAGRLPLSTLGGMFVLDGYALVFKGLFLAVGIVVVLLSIEYMRGHRYEGEYYFLLLCSVLGCMLMPSSRDLLMLFISLELVSVPAFVIAGLRKQDPRSNEAALKFFLFGVLSAGVLVYGISLVYGSAGTTNLYAIAEALGPGRPDPLLLGAIMLIVAAFGFKVSAVPFHFWAPDTYEGSPPPLAAFLGVASKAAGFVGLALIMAIAFPASARFWGPVLGLVAVFTMTVGNALALKQQHLMRLLAYSGIAHAGYMLIPVAVLRSSPGGIRATNIDDMVRALFVYLAIYAVMNLGAFALAIGISKQYPTLLIRDLAGLGRRAPFHALALGAFMISLGGIPPFAGWAAKFFVFLPAVNAGSRLGVVLAAVMVVNSVISLYYYVNVVRTMFLSAPERSEDVRFPPLAGLVVGACLAAVVFFGVFPETFVALARAGGIAFPVR